MLAKIEGGSTIYYHPDHLSARVLTDSAGNVLAQRGHFSFGESWYENGTATKFKFTTYERDAESGNDYAMARYDVNRLGRFASPDPLSGSTANPQSLNRYPYVANDPVNLVDPSGRFVAPQLYALMHSIGASSFGSMWNEFDLFGLGNKASTTITQTLTASLIDYSCAGGACTGIVQYSLDIATAINFSSSLFLDPFSGGGGGGKGGGGVDNVKQLRLIVEADCLDSKGRFISYVLTNVVTNKPPNGSYTITENFRDWTGSGPAPHTSDGPNRFDDTQATYFGYPPEMNSKQHFTISGSGIDPNTTIPVRLNGQDYGELGIWRAMPPTGSPYAIVFINGTQAASKAAPGTLCPNDPFQ
jgi:RHS repeat-associated protein